MSRRTPPPLLDLTAANRALETFGRRSLDALLPPGLQSARFTTWRPMGSAAVVAIGRGAWEQMTLNEYRSQVGFTELLRAMTQLGLSRDALQTMERLTRDEVVHVELCRRVVRGLGGGDLIPGEPAWVGLDGSLPPLEQVVEMVMTSLCIGEVLSCAMLGAAAKVTKDPMVKAVLNRMTADESVHGQSGFHFLQVLWPAVSRRRRRWFERRASHAARQAFAISLEPYDDVTHPFGALPYARLSPLLHRTWTTRIGPGFARLSVRVAAPFVA